MENDELEKSSWVEKVYGVASNTLFIILLAPLPFLFFFGEDVRRYNSSWFVKLGLFGWAVILPTIGAIIFLTLGLSYSAKMKKVDLEFWSEYNHNLKIARNFAYACASLMITIAAIIGVTAFFV